MKVAALLVLSGCFGLMAGHGPGPSGPGDPPVACSSLAWPAIDGVIAASLGYGLATCRDPMCGLGSIGAVPIAVIAAASATYGVVVDLRCDNTAAEQARFQSELAYAAATQHARHEQAWQLMQPAAAAARAGDCATVTRADAQIRALDDDFHASVFVRDVAIARCLTSPAASSSPSP